MTVLFTGNNTVKLHDDGSVQVPIALVRQINDADLPLSMYCRDDDPGVVLAENFGAFSGDFTSFPTISESHKVCLPQEFTRTILGNDKSAPVTFVGVGRRFQIMREDLWHERLAESRELLRAREGGIKALRAAPSQTRSSPAGGGVLVFLHPG